MKKLFSPFNLLLMALMASFSSAMALDGLRTNSKEQMIAEFERAKAYTREYLDAMPADGYGYKPTEEMRSFAQQMLHIAGANYGLGAAATGMANPYEGKNLEKMDEMQSKEMCTKAVDDSYDFLINSIKNLSDDQLSETVKIFRWDMSREDGLMKTFEHQTHHRGQTTVYLRLKGVTPPAEKLF